jgi:hypothetical protein
MDLVVDGAWSNPRRAAAQNMARLSDAQRAQMGQPLRISVPTQGILFAFEKLYANQSPDPAAFSIRYASADANVLALVGSLAGTALLWLGIAAIGSGRIRLSRSAIIASLTVGLALLLVSIGYLGTTPVPASGLALVVALILAAWWSLGRWRTWRQGPAGEPSDYRAESEC